MGQEINLKLLLRQALQYWYLFVTALPICIALAYMYLEHKQPEYETTAMLLLKQGEYSGKTSEAEIFADLKLGKAKTNLKNEIRILQSEPLMQQVVENLNLQQYYTRLEGFRQVDLYRESPVKIVEWEPKNGPTALYAELTDGEGGDYTLEVEHQKTKQEFQGTYGKPVQLPTGKLTLSKNSWGQMPNPILLEYIPAPDMAAMLCKQLYVSIVEPESSILSLGITDVSPRRAHDVLRELIRVYNESSIAEENQVYNNTIALINDRIGLISGELAKVEMEKEVYKQQFSSMQLSSEGNLLMNEIASYSRTIASQEVQLEILESIERFLTENQDHFEFVPTNREITNLTLVNQLQHFNELLAKREQMRSDLGPSHPDLKLTDNQIQNLRGTIIENIRTIKSDLQLNQESTRNLRNGLEQRMRGLPTRERELIEIERQKKIKEDLYVYLLQKREEAAISLATTVAKGKIIEPPGIPSEPISPKRMQIWLIALFLGLAAPAGLALLMDSLNGKVRAGDDLARFTSVPVLGAIGLHKGGGHVAIQKGSRTPLSEMFRLLRTNLAAILPGKLPQVMMVTSSNAREGKSFLTLNLGMTHALAGKRVLILELDLRRPRQEVYSKLKTGSAGVSNFLEDTQMGADQVIRNSGLHERLDLISSGNIPTDPGELMLSERLRELVEELKGSYDFIIIDAPPIGVVADALQLRDVVGTTLYVVRVGYTQTEQLQIIEDVSQKGKLPNPYIILNALPMSKASGYGYSYGYGMGSYGYGDNGYYGQKPRSLAANLAARLNGAFFSKFLS